MTQESDVGAVEPAPAVLRRLAGGVTVSHLALTVVAVAIGGTLRGIIGVVFVVYFLLGIVLFVSAFLSAANRSRVEEVTVVGAFFLGDGAVSSRDRLVFTGGAVIQSIVGIAGSIARPFTAVAFSILVPLLGLALMAMVGAKYGQFATRK